MPDSCAPSSTHRRRPRRARNGPTASVSCVTGAPKATSLGRGGEAWIGPRRRTRWSPFSRRCVHRINRRRAPGSGRDRRQVGTDGARRRPRVAASGADAGRGRRRRRDLRVRLVGALAPDARAVWPGPPRRVSRRPWGDRARRGVAARHSREPAPVGPHDAAPAPDDGRAAPPLAGRAARSNAMRAPPREQRLRGLEIRRFEALGEPTVDRCQELTRRVGPPLVMPQPSEAGGAAQLQG